MLCKFSPKIHNSLIREKLYKSFNFYPGFEFFSQSFDVTEIKLIFLLSNNLTNKSIFFSLLLLLEKITLSSFSFIVSKKTIANFNMKKNLRIGATYTLRNLRKDEFLHLFINYSIKKLNDSFIFINPEKGTIKLNYNNSMVGLGMRALLFNSSISLNSKDYEFFSPFFENMLYGFYIYFYTGFRNLYLNKLILSQYGMLIY